MSEQLERATQLAGADIANDVAFRRAVADANPLQAAQLAAAIARATIWNAAIDKACRDVALHWNDARTIVNQREQALNSAAALQQLRI